MTRMISLLCVNMVALFSLLLFWQGITKEKLRVLLENGYVDEVVETPTTFAIKPYTGDIVLLHGGYLF